MRFEEKVIFAVRKRPALYDRSSADYKNSSSREDAWKDVQCEVGIEDLDLIKRRWRNLRDSFIKSYRLENKPTKGLMRGRKRKWCYYNDCLFLVPHIESKDLLELARDDNVYTKVEDDYETEDNLEAESKSFSAESDNDSVDRKTLISRRNAVQVSSSADKEVPNTYRRNFRRNQRQVLKRRSGNPVIRKPDDDDQLFLSSLLPIFKRLPVKKNMKARMKIQQLLYNIEFDDGLCEADFRLDSRPASSLSHLSLPKTPDVEHVNNSPQTDGADKSDDPLCE